MSAFQRFNVSTFRPALYALPLVWLWFVLINHLRVEWSVNPQYGYGWAVPLLCAYLIWHKARGAGKKPAAVRTETPAPAGGKKNFSRWALPLSAFALALLYAPTRLVEQANPEWRFVSWALAGEVIGLTLVAIAFALGGGGLKRFAFPVLFFLVAVPWPTPLEAPLIQGLTRADAAITCELLGWLNIPAIPHGNVIEVATGEVGIDEACSGIRSFQATLMISLFLGELYALNWARRVSLVLGGFVMSFGFNLVRMSVLVWVAAREGVGAIHAWHDPTGVTILLACFFGLWGLGVWLKAGNRRAEARGHTAEAGAPAAVLRPPPPALGPLAVALAIWILAVEGSVAAWYGWHEARLPAAVQWTVAWPTNNVTFRQVTLPPVARQILRFDEGHNAAWSEAGLNWQVIFLRWNPGSTALHLAQNHTPEICLTAAGNKLAAIPGRQWLEVRGLRLPFQVYEVLNAPRPLFVFYCLWDDRADAQDFETLFLTYGNRLTPVRQGLRNPGQRSLEMVVSGVEDAAAAGRAVRAELEKIITTNP